MRDKIDVLKSLLKLLDDQLVVVDIGARWGFQPHWKVLEEYINLIGFDADDKEIDSLRTSSQGSGDFASIVLGSQNGYGTFYKTVDPACSSLYEPDEKIIRNRPSMYVTKLVSTEKVKVVTLDDWMDKKDISKVAFLKLDVQGGELAVLMGSEETLKNVRMLEVEVQFNPLYQNVPLFGDVDRFLRDRGFTLWRINNFCHYGMSEFSLSFTTDEEIKYDYFTKRFKGRSGQLHWGDAYYVRKEIADNDERAWQTALMDACIAGAMGFEDIFISSLNKTLEKCPLDVGEKIKDIFAADSAVLAAIVQNQTSNESDVPLTIGSGLQDDEAVEFLKVKAQLELLQAENTKLLLQLKEIQVERDNAVQQLASFYQSRSFKLVSALQAVSRFFRRMKPGG
jgi:FkbM family methyltransferase